MSTRDLVVRTGAALAAIPGPVLWGLVIAGAVDPFLASYVMVVGVCVGFVMVLVGPWLDTGQPTTPQERMLDMLLLWTICSTCAQLGWELPFSLLSGWLVGVTEHDTWAWLFWAYGVADARYLIADPFTVVMEGFTSMVGGPLEIVTIWLMLRRRLREAALLGLGVAVTQWYGCVLYFGIEAYAGFVHVNFSVFWDWALKFAFLNALWLIMPMVQAWAALQVLQERGSEAELAGLARAAK